jgi:hypothetical protein
MIKIIAAFLALVVIGVVIGACVAYVIRSMERNDALEAGFDQSEVDKETGAGKGIVHFIKYG